MNDYNIAKELDAFFNTEQRIFLKLDYFDVVSHSTQDKPIIVERHGYFWTLFHKAELVISQCFSKVLIDNAYDLDRIFPNKKQIYPKDSPNYKDNRLNFKANIRKALDSASDDFMARLTGCKDSTERSVLMTEAVKKHYFTFQEQRTKEAPLLSLFPQAMSDADLWLFLQIPSENRNVLENIKDDPLLAPIFSESAAIDTQDVLKCFNELAPDEISGILNDLVKIKEIFAALITPPTINIWIMSEEKRKAAVYASEEILMHAPPDLSSHTSTEIIVYCLTTDKTDYIPLIVNFLKQNPHLWNVILSFQNYLYLNEDLFCSFPVIVMISIHEKIDPDKRNFVWEVFSDMVSDPALKIEGEDVKKIWKVMLEISKVDPNEGSHAYECIKPFTEGLKLDDLAYFLEAIACIPSKKEAGSPIM